MGSAQSSTTNEKPSVHNIATSLIESQIKHRREVDGLIKACEIRIAAASTLVPKLDEVTRLAQDFNRIVERLIDKVSGIQQVTEEYERTHPNAPALSFVENQPSLKVTAEGFIDALHTLQWKISPFIDALSRQHGGGCKILESDPTMAMRLRESRAAIENSMKASYELLHPVHRFPVELTKDIFSLVVHEEFMEARNTLSTRPYLHMRMVTAPVMLSMVCSPWRAVVYATPELWQFVTLNDSGSPFTFRMSESRRDISVLARGFRFPKLCKLAGRSNIKELIVDCGEIDALQLALHSLPMLTRLLICYTGARSPSVRIALPSKLSQLHTLSFCRILPDIPDYLLTSLRALALANFDHYPHNSTMFWQFLRQAPKLRKLVILETTVNEMPVALKHESIESIITNKPFPAGAQKSIFPRLSSFNTYTTTSLDAVIADARFATVMNDLQVVRLSFIGGTSVT